jgi:uncharacterized protein YajQ (UPF0234 family)
MAADNSFDIVSKVDIQEVKNAIEQATKEVNARFDLKDSKSTIKLDGEEKGLELHSSDSYKLEAVTQILEQKLIKRGVSIKSLEFGKEEPASNSSVRQKVTLKQGIAGDKAKEIVKHVRETRCALPAKTAILYRKRSRC